MDTAGIAHIKNLIEFNVSADCTAFGFGIYPVRSSANPMKSDVKAAVNFTFNVCKENTTDSFLVPSFAGLPGTFVLLLFCRFGLYSI